MIKDILPACKFSKKDIAFFLLSGFLILIVLSIAVYSNKHLPHTDFSITDWIMNNVSYNNENHTFYVEESLKDNGTPTDIIWGPFKNIKAGSYSANIEYSAEEDQSCYIYPTPEKTTIIKSSTGILSHYTHNITYNFETTENIDNFDFRIQYNGSGDFSIKSINIVPNNNQIKRNTFTSVAAILLLDSFIIFRKFSEDKRKTIVLLIGISLLVSIPLFINGIFTAPDIEFHLLRIEAVVQALRSKQFPARISSIAMYGLGYPFSIFYNDLFLYFPAILRILGYSINSSYKIFVFAVNLTTVLISYYSFKKIFSNKQISIISTLLYVSSAYRMNCIYVRAGVGEFTAMAFFPLLAFSLYKIYTQNNINTKNIIKNSFLLAVSLSGIIGSHVISAFLTAFIMLIICLILLKKTIQKQVLLTFICAFFITILMNLYFIVPFLDYYFNVDIAIKGMFVSSMIQKDGIFPTQLFVFFRNVLNSSHASIHDEKMMHSPGIPLLSSLIIELYFLLTKGKTGKKIQLYLLFSIFTIFLSTNIFPWDFFTLHIPLWSFMTQILYPWRFISLSIIFLTLLAGEFLLSNNSHKINGYFSIAAVLNVLIFSSIIFHQREFINIYETASLDKNPRYYEYFLKGSSLYDFDTEIHGTNIKSVQVKSRSANMLKFYCEADENSEKHTILAPVYNYKGYHAFDDTGREFTIYNGLNNQISFDLPDYFSGEITIVFRAPGYWTASLIVSAAVSFFVLTYLIYYNTRKYFYK